MARKLKIWNGRDWNCRGGHLYVCAHSVRDCADLASEAYRKVQGMEDRLDVRMVNENEVRTYWSAGCWGNAMEGVVPERGVWWAKSDGHGRAEKPERVI